MPHLKDSGKPTPFYTDLPLGTATGSNRTSKTFLFLKMSSPDYCMCKSSGWFRQKLNTPGMCDFGVTPNVPLSNRVPATALDLRTEDAQVLHEQAEMMAAEQIIQASILFLPFPWSGKGWLILFLFPTIECMSSKKTNLLCFRALHLWWVWY